MKKLLFAIGLLLFPLNYAIADEGNPLPSETVDASASVEVPVIPVDLPNIDPGQTAKTVVDAVNQRDWQVMTAGLLSLIWLFLLRFLVPINSFFHTLKGKALITSLSSLLGAMVPLLQTHNFSLAMLVSALTSAGFTFLALVTPQPKETIKEESK